jgi:hypothetical protein
VSFLERQLALSDKLALSELALSDKPAQGK